MTMALFLFHLLLKFFHSVPCVTDCLALLLKKCIRVLAVLLIIQLSDFRIILFDHFLTGCNLAFQIYNFRCLPGFIRNLSAFTATVSPSFSKKSIKPLLSLTYIIHENFSYVK